MEVPVRVIEAVESSQLTATLKGHANGVWQVAWSPDGKILASVALTDGEIKLWDAAERKERATLRSDLGTSYGLAFTPDGKTLAVGHYKTDPKAGPTGGISLWNMATGQRIGLLQHTSPRGVSRMVLSADGKMLAAAESWKEGDKDASKRCVTLWDISTGKAVASLPDENTSALAFSPNGKVLARSVYSIKDNQIADVEIRRRDLTTGKDLTVLSNTTSKNPINSLAFAPDGRTCAGSDHEGNIILWETESAKVRTTFKEQDSRSIMSLAFAPDGKTLTAAVGHSSGRDHEPGQIVLWEVASGERRVTLTGHTNAVLSVAFSPDGKLLASGSSDRTVRLWDVTAEAASVR